MSGAKIDNITITRSYDGDYWVDYQERILEKKYKHNIRYRITNSSIKVETKEEVIKFVRRALQ